LRLVLAGLIVAKPEWLYGPAMTIGFGMLLFEYLRKPKTQEMSKSVQVRVQE
jgi:hypothetical protein